MRKLVIPALALAGVVACTGDGPTSAVAPGAPATANHGYAGASRTPSALSGRFVPLNCSPRHESNGSALIGPSGGILRVGNHRLIIPAGALREKVLISGTVPEGKPFQIDLQPHGLQFRKAAGLILDATSCIDVPTIVYLVDQFTVSDPIPAFYSNWWKAIACPIWHFSGYAIAFDGGDQDDAGSAQ